jgi:NTP pyrophosphatase (non-canonical NTP hydrolase)
MDMNKYQSEALATAVYFDAAFNWADNAEPEDMVRLLSVQYAALGMCGEAGEVANKVKKLMRDHDPGAIPTAKLDAIAQEVGDVMWYCAAILKELGNYKLAAVATGNISKLLKRQEDGTLSGEGDNR